MTQQEITKLNFGYSADDIVNIDPRGYGVCKILYSRASRLTGQPLCINGARELCRALEAGGTVYIITGFVLLPYKLAETDGAVGAALLARCLIRAFGVRVVFVCPSEAEAALAEMARVCGCGENAFVFTFTKDREAAPGDIERLLSGGYPQAVISIEAPGANMCGVYHNASGCDISAYEAKSDILFDILVGAGVPSVAIGDLGNEIGMGVLRDHIRSYVPHALTCACACGGGLAAVSRADCVITATASDWGAYALCAAVAYLRSDAGLFFDAHLQRAAIEAGTKNGLINIDGEHVPAIDGFGARLNETVVTMLHELLTNTLTLRYECAEKFALVAAGGFFERYDRV